MPRKSPNKTPRPSGSNGIEKLTDSAVRGELVAVIGTGVSVGLTNGKIPALSWRGLILDGFARGLLKGKITAGQDKAWKAQLASKDLDDLLAAAEFVSRKLDAPKGELYARWLEDVFKPAKPANKRLEDALRALQARGIPLCTLNYDPLLERVTGLPAVNMTETVKVNEWMRKEQSVLHLHGSWDAPASCILGIRDYQTTLENSVRELIQRSLGSFRRLLFIGCGETFADPNFSALIKWLREKMGAAVPAHFALVVDGEVAARHADPAWQGFVEPAGYGKDHGDLAGFLLKHFAPPAPGMAKTKGSAKVLPHASRRAKLLEDYRAFLIKDCGQMTIEGVRADMDTAQRRFDLERLFVPLQVLPSLPDIPEADPERERKLIEWREKNKEPLPFGAVFAKHKRLALLALPGGGKTLLLKRLAVAYADSARRRAASDELPDMDLTPVLIRCREWREHIHRPILTLLQSIGDITGQPGLIGLDEALIPLFKTGHVLLLLDGLDEIHDDALRTTFVDHLEQFLVDYDLTRVVVTSREAGFALVAPSLARFCGRWHVAPLGPAAITTLCDHWHRLMTGESPEAQAESKEVAELLLGNESLRRLAENPLLLTMLLVVKHGAGRLPPDRVSLYSRAVEVLLDTWNIKGHDPLNVKEAVPQLAFVAFELMRAGKQTATEKELLALLEEAREKVPQIRRYAKDTPQEFLRRVELRSSLLMEAGRQAEAGGTVPFYQFRHLTFQEYLAAVAAVDGHYIGYNKSDTVMTPLGSYFMAEEWKEVIPMAAVLARKQAEPLISALVLKGNELRQKVEAEADFPGRKEWVDGTFSSKLPIPAARLVQCLLEEAEAAPETLLAAMQLVVFFARGCHSQNDWRALSQGPYGEELLHQGLLLYIPMQWPRGTWLRDTCSTLARLRKSDSYWHGSEGQEELVQLLKGQNTEDLIRGLLTLAGLLFDTDARSIPVHALMSYIEPHIFQGNLAIQEAALWAWSLINLLRKNPDDASPVMLDRLLSLWLVRMRIDDFNLPAYALFSQFGLPRLRWTPSLSREQIQKVRKAPNGGFERAAACLVAFHSRAVWTERKLAKELADLKKSDLFMDPYVDHMLEQLDKEGMARIRRVRKGSSSDSGPGVTSAGT